MIPRSEEDSEIDDSYFAEEEDLAFASADPSMPLHQPEPNSDEETHDAPLPRETRYCFQLLPGRLFGEKWVALFNTIVPRIFAEYGVDQFAGAIYVSLEFDSERAREDYLDLVLESRGSDTYKESRHYVTWVQDSILEIFRDAPKNGFHDLEKVLEEIRGNLEWTTDSSALDVNEFLRRSNGHSRFLQTQIDYNGSWNDGAFMNDGITIQSGQSACRAVRE